MFIDNKYKIWYYQIINRASNRILLEYTEKHHIVPKSLGGSNDKTNLVELTAREHLICHMLLPKIVSPEYKKKMIFALWAMTSMENKNHTRYKITSKRYEKIKKEMASAKSDLQKGPLNHFYKKKHTEETKEKIRLSRLGKKDSEELKLKKSLSAKHRPPVTEITKEKLRIINKGKPGLSGPSNGFYGKTHSKEQREKKRQEKLNSPRLICLHCCKLVDNMNYARWHGDRCKKRK